MRETMAQQAGPNRQQRQESPHTPTGSNLPFRDISYGLGLSSIICFNMKEERPAPLTYARPGDRILKSCSHLYEVMGKVVSSGG